MEDAVELQAPGNIPSMHCTQGAFGNKIYAYLCILEVCGWRAGFSCPIHDLYDEMTPARAGAAPLSVMVAAGPFTTADSLDFEPLSELLAAAARTLPVSQHASDLPCDRDLMTP